MSVGVLCQILQEASMRSNAGSSARSKRSLKDYFSTLADRVLVIRIKQIRGKSELRLQARVKCNY